MVNLQTFFFQCFWSPAICSTPNIFSVISVSQIPSEILNISIMSPSLLYFSVISYNLLNLSLYSTPVTHGICLVALLCAFFTISISLVCMGFIQWQRILDVASKSLGTGTKILTPMSFYPFDFFQQQYFLIVMTINFIFFVSVLPLLPSSYLQDYFCNWSKSFCRQILSFSF